MNLSFEYSNKIEDYRSLIDTLVEDFDYVFIYTILQHCGLANNPYKDSNQYWDLFIVKLEDETVGIGGLYSLKPNYTKSLWLGWLGIVPEHRNKNIGSSILDYIYEQAKLVECKEILSYVDKEGRALNFYKREGFEVLGIVKKCLESNLIDPTELEEDVDEFDYIVRKYI